MRKGNKKVSKKVSKKVYKKQYNEARAHYLPEWKETGAFIKAKRTEKGISQNEMAEKCGRSIQYYGHMEQGYNNPKTLPIAVKAIIAETLGFEFEELWG